MTTGRINQVTFWSGAGPNRLPKKAARAAPHTEIAAAEAHREFLYGFVPRRVQRERTRTQRVCGRALHLFGFLVTFSKQPIVTKWPASLGERRRGTFRRDVPWMPAMQTARTLNPGLGERRAGTDWPVGVILYVFPSGYAYRLFKPSLPETRTEPGR